MYVLVYTNICVHRRIVLYISSLCRTFYRYFFSFTQFFFLLFFSSFFFCSFTSTMIYSNLGKYLQIVWVCNQSNGDLHCSAPNKFSIKIYFPVTQQRNFSPPHGIFDRHIKKYTLFLLRVFFYIHFFLCSSHTEGKKKKEKKNRSASTNIL